MSLYDAIFFDLDHTLWDYETNSRYTLLELHDEYKLQERYGISSRDFLSSFNEVNHGLWDRYNKREIDREEIRSQRFRQILLRYYVENNELSNVLSDDYITRCPTKTYLFPYALEILDYLRNKYPLFILTNGFDDVQEVKLHRSELKPYFQGVITSETTGHRKPSPEIFLHAVKEAGVTPARCLMIGDNLMADIRGAMDAGLHAAYFNPARNRHSLSPHYEISCLSEVRNIL